MNIDGRRTRGHSKKERERQLDTPKNHPHHLTKKMVDLEWIVLHFGSISDPKMDAKFNKNIVWKQLPSKINQNGVSEIDPIQVDRG